MDDFSDEEFWDSQFFDGEHFGNEELLMEDSMNQSSEPMLINQNQQQQEEDNTGGTEQGHHTFQNQQQQEEDNTGGTEQGTEQGQHTFQTQDRGRKQLTEHEKRTISDEIMQNMTEGKVPWGFQTKIATKYGIHRTTIGRLYKYIQQKMQDHEEIVLTSGKKGKTGRKPMFISDMQLQSVPLCLRTKLRTYANALNVSLSTLFRLKKSGRIRPHTSSNHPSLTPKHKIARLKWVLQHVHPIPHDGNPTYIDMQQAVHIDEKWFYLNPETRRFYLLPTEEDPYKTQQSKRFKVKAMFEAAIGKPLYASDGTLLHDGKFGIYPFVTKQRAIRSSKNRTAGTWETKAVNSVTKEATRRMLLDNIIPAIQANWHPSLPKDVFIQWDNARPHQIPRDEEFVSACTSNGFNIQLVFQPPQSPDMNVLDLGLFRVIQSLQYETFPKDLDELIVNVKDAYENFCPTLNKYTWITLQTCMTEVLKNKGSNNYKTPHMGKARLDSLGILPEILEVDKELIAETVHYLDTTTQATAEDRESDSDMDLDTQAQVDVD